VIGFSIRAAGHGDLGAMGRLGALLLREHHARDPDRFMAPGVDPEGGYAWFLGTQLAEPDVLLLVAESDDREVAGYLYAGIEPRSWKELREEAGFIHDVVVDERFRGRGIAAALVERAASWFRDRGMPRMMLWTADQNPAAQRLFTRLGFRRTTVEMTRELGGDEPPSARSPARPREPHTGR
jgi:GNAT superfamily N-acetyltransferase